ncbi:hypothetical protein HII36_54980, partial [Nonomuraea sp. NN258]|uniref:hypothetical protein n=1 Tax=Nonomuraea antri TaxID=2730852 RepID=UPI00156995E0
MSAQAAPGGRNIHVTSSAIGHLRGRVDDELKVAMAYIKSLTDTVHVDAPGFGLLGGMVLGSTYEGMRGRAEELLGAAEKCV